MVYQLLKTRTWNFEPGTWNLQPGTRNHMLRKSQILIE